MIAILDKTLTDFYASFKMDTIDQTTLVDCFTDNIINQSQFNQVYQELAAWIKEIVAKSLQLYGKCDANLFKGKIYASVCLSVKKKNKDKRRVILLFIKIRIY